MKIKAINMRKGNVIVHKGELYRLTEVTHVTPGKGQALMSVKMKRVSDGIKAEERFRPNESVEKASLENKEFQYLYADGEDYHFMDMETYEQISLDKEILGDSTYFLLENTMVSILFHGTTTVDVELPTSVEMKVVETDPNLKGATVTTSYKPATLETGYVTQIPPFIETGETIRVDTRDGKYLDRVK